METMFFYGLYSQKSETENVGVLREQAELNFSKSSGSDWPLSQKNEFAEADYGCETNQFRTFSIVLPNLIHQSKKRDL